LNTLACEPENVSRSRPVAREPVLDRLTAKFQGLASVTTMRASIWSASFGLLQRDLHLLALALVGNGRLHRQCAEVGRAALRQLGQAGADVGSS
jgi:hypothetical protein